jgi:uncharacterized protein
MAAKFILNEREKGCFQFTFHTPDNQLLLTSPLFTDREQALRRIDTMRSLARRDENLDVCSTGAGQFYIVLKDNKSKVLGQSGIIADRQSLQKALDAIKRCSRGTRLLDLTPQGRAALPSKKLKSSRSIQKRQATFPRIILTQNVTGHYSFTFRAPDGQLLLTSPFFTEKDTALRRIASTLHLAQRDGNYAARSAGGGQYYFELKNNEGQMLGPSTVYTNGQSVHEGIASLKSCAMAGRLLDLTIPE